jgi:hypothetical protein
MFSKEAVALFINIGSCFQNLLTTFFYIYVEFIPSWLPLPLLFLSFFFILADDCET